MKKPRIPDYVSLEQKFIAEAKWVGKGRVAYTDQIIDTASLARHWNVRYGIYVRQNTSVSERVRELVESTGGRIIRIFE
jgi:hypothetical protein